MKNIIKTLLIYLLFATSGCESFVDIPPAANLMQTDQVFSSEQGVTAAVNGVYTYLRSGSHSFLNGGVSLYSGLAVGEIYNTAASTTYDPFYKNLIPTTNTTVNSMFWSLPYNTIYRCNLIMEGTEKSQALSKKFKDQVIGEMLFVRALVYHYLINLYGDVPLVLTTDYVVNSVMPRTSAITIYEQLKVDLNKAQLLLTPSYPSVGKTRPNVYAVMALLARVYLYNKDDQKAFETADLVIKSNTYSLTTDLTKTFLINSTETIWEIAAPGEARNSAEALLFIPTSTTAKPTLAIPDSYVNVFENVDKRKSSWLGRNVNAGITYYYPAKLKSRLTTPITEYEVVFRLSEMYLIKAESAAQIDDINAAVTALNVVRRRAGLTDVAQTISKPALLTAILQERQREFLGEWGHRWFDLKRLGIIGQVLAIDKPDFKAFAQWFPIPQAQISFNQNLTQNEGYD